MPKELTTPKAISFRILELCARIDAQQSPTFVKVQPRSGYKINDCFINVRKHVDANGGIVQYGWSIWEHPEVLIEGMFHAIWDDGQGNFLDVTPPVDGESEILFLPDSKRIYENVPVDNVRMPLTTNPAILARYKRMEAFTKLRAKHNIDGAAFTLPVKELMEVLRGATHQEMRYLLGEETYQSLLRAGDLHVPKTGRNELCSCGSGIKFKKCCGK